MMFFECVDLWIEPPDDREEVLGSLVEKARLCAEQDGYDRILLPHFDREIAEAYRRLGLLEMSAPRRPEFYRGPPELMERITPENSYFVLAEGDYGL
jgi:hypothetical protein